MPLIVDLVDAGRGRSPGGGIVQVLAQFCGRSNCSRLPVDGHDFCRPCLDWLRCDTDHDPLAPNEGGTPVA
jgi:hypothetical protein